MAKYNNETDPDKKASIIVDPIVIMKKAIQNCKPILKLTSVKRGGSYYQVCFNSIITLIFNYVMIFLLFNIIMP